ncbi:MAG: response regulator transcription factor [Chloroflexia bacterium]|jgi:DNA-binding response OmpR family regulator|nr:response regulator transcription factor [Chloroflexia bacterium]
MEHKTTVLVVDDEEDIVSLMRDFLEAEGYLVQTAHDGRGALDALAHAPVDCVLLDIMMPGQSGFDVLRRIRALDDVPVLFLSARQEDSDKIRGLGLGADDYIVKSATPGEIVARIKAVLRRYQRGEPQVGAQLDYGRLVLDVRAHEVRVDGEPVQCTRREFELLQLLAENPRQVFTREDLFERFWGEFGDRHTLTVHIGRLREKIEEDPARPRYIVTVWGVGYRFEGERRK